MNLKTFKKIANQVSELEKAGIKFDVLVRGDNEWQADAATACFEPHNFTVTSLKQLSDIQAITNKTVSLSDSTNKVAIAGLTPTACVKEMRALIQEIKAKPLLKLGLNTFKFFSDGTRYHFYDFAISMITDAPTEQTEDGVTYRYIGDKNTCKYCIPDTHELYNYLDRGFFFCNVVKQNSKAQLIITNELTLDTFLCMLLCWIQPTFIKQLTNGCYINANQAKLLRVKFEKDLKEYKVNYDSVKAAALKEYETTANSNIMQRVAEGKIPHATYNNIKFTKDSATYETISIKANDLLTVLQSYVAFDDRTDIYTIIRDYVRYVIAQLDNEDLAHGAIMPVATGDAAVDEKAMAKYLAKAAKAVVVEHEFSINGIPLVLKRTSENTRRYVNGVMINRIEVEEVVFQASCYEVADTYDKFVKSVSKMSLKWHNALSNGVPMKIHGNMTWEEYRNPLAPAVCPRIRFTKDDKDFKLVVGESGETVKIKFNECLKKLATLNRQTSNSYGGGYGRRDHTWAQSKLVTLLKECCTFDVKTITTTTVDEQVYDNLVDAEGKPTGEKQALVNPDGTMMIKKVKKKNVVVTKVCTLSDDQAKFVGKMADEFFKKALEKSKLALANAVKNTGATLVQFNGEEAYLVQGALRKYAVIKSNNRVYDYERKSYVCIVDSGHHVQVGFDALAGRLYALKNDSVMVNKIGTLRTHG